jgi:ribosomal protein S18 acetylase RimI-like enzyme
MEANFAEEMNSFGRGLSGGEVHDDGELTWFYTGRPYLNGVTRTHLVDRDEAYVNQKIAHIIRYYTTRTTSFAWGINPQTQPANMNVLLEAHGFQRLLDHTLMALDTRHINESFSSPPDLTITEVVDADELRVFMDVSRRGFDSTAEQTQNYYENYLAHGFGPEKQQRFYIGRLASTPVACASLLLHAGVAGIYGVATLPEARRQGIAASMTVHALQEARAFGYYVAILAPSEMGMSMYKRIGFEEYSHSTIYSFLYEHGQNT